MNTPDSGDSVQIDDHERRRTAAIARAAQLQGGTPEAYAAAEGVMGVLERLVDADLDQWVREQQAKDGVNNP